MVQPSFTLCYEHITDDYYYAQYGKFNIVLNMKTDFFNATKLCKDNGKRISDWTSLLAVKALLKHVTMMHGGNGCITGFCYREPHSSALSGTYIHMALLPALAMWLSPEFYMCVARLTENFVQQLLQVALGDALYYQNTKRNIEVTELNKQLHTEAQTLKDCRDKVSDLIDMGSSSTVDWNSEIADRELRIELLNGAIANCMKENEKLRQEVNVHLQKLHDAEFVNASLDIQLASAAAMCNRASTVEAMSNAEHHQHPFYRYRLIRKEPAGNNNDVYNFTSLCVRMENANKAYDKVKRKYPFCDVVYDVDTPHSDFHNRVKCSKKFKTKYNDLSCSDENYLIQTVNSIYIDSFPTQQFSNLHND